MAEGGFPIAGAKLALEQAEAARETARRTLAALEGELQSAEDAVGFASRGLNDAVRDVLREAPEVQQLLADLDIAKRAVADILNKLFSLPAGVTGDLSWNLNEFQLGQQAKHPAWHAAIAALRTDADAALPSG